jgi:hypothetical protein
MAFLCDVDVAQPADLLPVVRVALRFSESVFSCGRYGRQALRPLLQRLSAA